MSLQAERSDSKKTRIREDLNVIVCGRNIVLLLLILFEWLYSPCGPSPLFQFPDLFYSKSIGLLE
jgi:hypothetical protein